jgi:5-methylcytosine-specific restriction endonuclease McrA
MPINKSLYHPNFTKRSLACIKRAGYACQECGVEKGTERMSKRGNLFKEQIHAHHINHDPWNPRAKLKALCTICHLKADKEHHAKNQRRTIYRKGYEAQIQIGQMTFNWKVREIRDMKTGKRRGITA